MKLSHILFDLDNTLYPASTGIFPEIARRMTVFVAKFFDCDLATAERIRQGYSEEYGTTLGGLLAEGGLSNPASFMEDVHPVNVADYIPKNPRLHEILVGLAHPKSVFTNSPLEHALRVLDHLEIRDCFSHIFDIRFCRYIGKPVRSAYEGVLETIGTKAGETLLLDDVPGYLQAYAAIGGVVLLMNEDGFPTGGFPSIRDIGELPSYLQKLEG